MKLLCKVTLVWLLLGLASCALTTPEATSAPSSSFSYRNGHEIISLRQFVERYEGLGPIAVTIWEKHLFTIQPIGTRDCDAEQVQCHRDCMEKAPPWPRRTNGWDHNAYCRATWSVLLKMPLQRLLKVLPRQRLGSLDTLKLPPRRPLSLPPESSLLS